MHRFPDPSPTRRRESDAGFTLIEVLVAFVIISIIAAAGTTLTIRGLRATMEAQHLSQAKNLVSAQVEQMRGLPYAVSQGTSTAPVDVLDKYFPNLAAPGASPNCSADAATWLINKASWSGYVSAGNASRCSFEPLTGGFYRTVVDPALVSGSVPTAIVVSTQFLGLATGEGTPAPPVNPATGYDSTDPTDTGKDSPTTSQVGVQVTAVWGAAGTAKKTTSRTDIADRRGGPALVSAETNAAAVVIDGTLATGETRRLELGTVGGEGSVTVVTRSAVEAIGASMQSTTSRVDGAARVATAPGSVSGSTVGGVLPFGDGTLSIGASTAANVVATNTASNPAYGQAVASATAGSFSLDQARPELGLTTANPLVAVASGGSGSIASAGQCPGSSGYQAFGAGYLNTGTGSPTTLDACAQAEASTVKLFPIAGTAPDGLIQVLATDIVSRCEISGNTPTSTTSGKLVVRWFTGGTTYAESTITLSGTTVTGSLPDLTTTTLGNGKKIGDYIASWGAFSGVEKVQSFDAATKVRTASAKVPAALSIATVPIRTLPDDSLDPDSAVKITIGRAIASATDRR